MPRGVGFLSMAHRLLCRLLRLLLHPFRFSLGLFGLNARLLGFLSLSLFGFRIRASPGLALFRSFLFRCDLSLGVFFRLLLDRHHPRFLGSFRGVLGSGVDHFAIALLAVGLFGSQ